MFGRKKPTRSRPNHVLNKITRDIESSFEDSPSIRQPDNIPYLPDGMINSSIPTNMLNSLPIHYQTRWRRIDFEKLYALEEPELEAEEPTSPDNPLSRVSRESDVYQDLFKLNQEAKDRLRAITLGEIPKEDKE